MTALVFIILCLIWGSTWLAIKIGLEDAPPFWSASLRFCAAGIILLVINYFAKSQYPRRTAELWQVAWPGIFMYSLPYLLVYWAEMHIGSALVAVLFASFPFFIALFAIPLLKDEKLGFLAWAGLIIGFGGIVVIFYDSLQVSDLVFGGSIAAVVGSASSAYSTVHVRARLHDYDFRVIAALQVILGTIFMLAVAVLTEPISSFKITAKSVLSLSYLTVFGTVVAFSGYYWILKKMRAIIVSMISFITPVIAIILGVMVGAEAINWLTAVGSALVLAGVVMVVMKK
jgi:drug/metabolite transporter (DMT)-like permease